MDMVALGFDCANCDIMCKSNLNPHYHPIDEEEYNNKRYNYE